jgi:general secretion pathway protein J
MNRHAERGFNPTTRCNPVAFTRSGGRVAKAAGFTLIEVLIATVLLAAGLTLAFATLGAATKTAQRGESMASQNERIRAVEGFLRRRVEGARAIPFNFDQSSGAVQRFIGEPDRMRFVADLPDYLGRGGPYLHDFAIEDGGERITLTLGMVLAGQTIEETDARPPEVLVEGLKSARFRYRSLSPEGGLGEWLDRWENADQLPLMVEITLTDAGGQEWPPVVVSLPLALAAASAPPMVTQ